MSSYSKEKFTEYLTKEKMEMCIGDNKFGKVFPQGDVKDIPSIYNLLKKAGGKPESCELKVMEQNKGKYPGKPEYIITLNEDIDTIIVIECKAKLKDHSSNELNKPKRYAVDGVLYYSKFLKEEYNVICIGISGVNPDNYKSTTYYWTKKESEPKHLDLLDDDILTPNNYLHYINGETISKKYSLEEIKKTAITFNENLRKIKITEKYKPLFIAGILIALESKDFIKDYKKLSSFNSVMNSIISNIEEVLKNKKVEQDRIDNLTQVFKQIKSNQKFKKIKLKEENSIRWYIKELELKILPMIKEQTNLDALGVFYHEFIKYAAADGKPLGMVLTPEHLTEFMCDLAEIDRNTKVVDTACGSGSFLVSAMNKMIKSTANEKEIINIKKNNLFGVELDPDLYMLSVTNMIIRKDGKSNIYNADSFDDDIIQKLREENINIGLLNPPYSQKDYSELDFLYNLLNILTPKGKAVVVVPLSCAIGTKMLEEREKLFKKHSLDAVFTMPDEIFYPTSTNVCVMIWTAHKPHNSNQNTFLARFKDDGFVKKKKIGRVDYDNKWSEIKNEWLKIYNEKRIIPEISLFKQLSVKDEWLCEAHLTVNYDKLTENDFQHTINEYLAYLVRTGEYNES